MDNSSLTIWQNRFVTYLSTIVANDGAHDLSHFKRVWNNCQHINKGEGNVADMLVLLTGSFLHDIVSFPKNDPRRSQSSLLSAEKAATLLRTTFTEFPEDKIQGVYHAIHAHSFSANVKTETMEAKILQDADRLDALGAVGLARVFYVAGQLGTNLFDPEDPLAEYRKLNENVFALDHFQTKLLRLPEQMQTKTGKQLAEERAAYLLDFMLALKNEIA